MEELAFSAAGSGGVVGKEGKEDWDPPAMGLLEENVDLKAGTAGSQPQHHFQSCRWTALSF